MKVLSIDGGGILGCGPARYLKLLESRVGSWEQCLAGTSVGALLVALRAVGKSWAEIDGIFQEEGPKIFAHPPLSWRMNPMTPKYPSTALENACRKYLGPVPCSGTVLPFYIPAMDMVLGRPKVFDNTDSDLLSDVVLRSTAAPTYFAPRDGRWVDGGLVANNPSGLAVMALIRKGVPASEISVLSLDTGGSCWQDPKVSGRMLPTSWISPVIHSQMAGNEEVGEFACDALLGDKHRRIVPKVDKDYQLDDVASVPKYTAIWESCWEATKQDSVFLAVC